MLKKFTKRIISFMAAAVMAVTNTVPIAPISALSDDAITTETETELTMQTIEVSPDETGSEAVITLEGMMPEGAEAQAVDVSEECDCVAAYDITITAGEEEFQPDEENPIKVEIADPVITDSEGLQLWHVKDDGEREQIFDFSVEEGKITFYAEGFSVYEIVKKEELPDVKPVTTNVVPEIVDSVEGLTSEKAAEGLYIVSYLSTNYTNNLTKNGYVSNVRNKNGAFNINNLSYADLNDQSDKYKWYVEKVENENSYYIYTYDGDQKKYIKKGSDDKAIDLVTNNGTKFSIDCNDDEYTGKDKDGKDEKNIQNYLDFLGQKVPPLKAFHLSVDSNTRWLQYSKSGLGLRFYTIPDHDYQKPNYRLEFYYASSFLPHYSDDPYNLDGKTYGLMNHSSGTVGNALMADPTTYYTQLFQLITRESQTSTNTNTLYVLENADITMWTFESAEEDLYYISTTVNGEKKYLHIDETDGITLTDEADKQKIKVTPKTSSNTKESGLIQLSADGYAISFEGNGNNSKFTVDVANSINANQFLAFVKKSTIEPDEVITYFANKVSVCDPQDSDEVIVYTRIWNDNQNAYEFYAIDHDGTLYPCYERGDNIMWVGKRVNTLLWKLTVYTDQNGENYYYELYNPYSKKYIAPQFPGQILSDNKIGINLPGRRDGEYYSKILAWDDSEYTYAGLADNNKQLTIERRDKAGTYYFASMAPIIPTLTEVETVDNTLHGITMKMVDFPDRATMNNFLGSDTGGAVVTTDSGLLSTKLGDDGYPTTAKTSSSLNGYTYNRSLGDLYKNNSVGTYSAATEVNHLFIQSTYDASGYFEFDSCQNTATLRTEGGSDGTNFKVYKELATDNSGGSTHKHGQFYPYNYIIPGSYSSAHPQNLYTALGTLLTNTDPRYGEPLYLLQKTGSDDPNHYNGMELSASFIQTPDGKDDWDHPIIFEFTGDDDFWLYVDGELVIDLGGIHSALAARVNFATGMVIVNGTETTLRDIFIKHYIDRDGMSEAEAESQADTLFKKKDGQKVEINGVEEDQYVFKDYTEHDMKIFYMERGAGASNLHMRFNLASVTPGSVMLTKTIDSLDTLDEELDEEQVEYPFQIWYNDGTGENRMTDVMNNYSVNYRNSSRPVSYEAEYTPSGTNIVIPNVFFLNPKKGLEIKFPDDTIQYKLVECGIYSDVYDAVTINGDLVPNKDENNNQLCYRTPTDSSDPTNGYYDYTFGWVDVENHQNAVFSNNIKNEKIHENFRATGFKTLKITKILYDKNNNRLSDSDDISTFNFRLYLTNGTSDTLSPANMYDYHVINFAGEYCTWNSVQEKFESLGTANYSALSEPQKYAATFETSMNGAISKIPAGYSVLVPNLPINSKFKVEERDNEIPLGYEFKEYQCVSASYQPVNSNNEGKVISEYDPQMNVCNQRGWGIDAAKSWSDSPFIISHDPVYVAVYAGTDLVSGTGRKITDSSPSVRYYFPSLLTGKAFKDYQVYEVELTDAPTFDADGNPTDVSIKSRRTKGTLFEVGAVHKANPGVSNDYSYKVEYDGMYVDAENVNIKNTATGETDVNGNTMSESITNTRTNGVEIFLYDMEDFGKETKTMPLENGVFTLKQNGIDMGSFTSDSDGKITILYSNTGTFQSGATYVLTQTAAPSKYIKAPFSIAFTVDGNNKTVTCYQDKTENLPGKWADGAPENDTGEIIAKINVYNKQVELKAVKVDSNNANKTLSGAKFALYRGVKGIDGMGKDNTPIYNNLVTDENGVIPNINMNLLPDEIDEEGETYFLTEVAAPSNYEKLTQDIQFTFHKDGTITLDSSGQGETLPTPDDTTDKYSYQISIPNTSLSSDYYFDIEKIIFVDKNVHDSDKEQKYIFKVERFDESTTDFTTTPADVFYVTMNCDKEMTYTSDTDITLDSLAYNYSFYHDRTDTAAPKYEFISSADGVKIKRTYSTDIYTFPAAIWNGRKTVHVTSEGIYRISEVTGWSSTDYDFWSGSNVYKGYGDSDKTTNHITDGGTDGYVIFNVSDVKADQYKDDGFKITEGGKDYYRPTASFTNSETEYAYLSSQAYADNKINRSSS